MAELVDTIGRLFNRGENVHWFCPRSTADDESLFFDEDLTEEERQGSEREKETRAKALTASREIHDEALEACKILAFDGEDARSYQEKLRQRLNAQLTRCDVCVREYHRSRRRFRDRLEADYNPEEVHSFMEIFDEMNIARIRAGLDQLTSKLEKQAPAERNIKAAGDLGMYALFEALNCIPFLRHEEVLKKHFDPPFSLVQTKRKLKLGSFVPAMTSFLFSHVPERREWAERSFRTAKHAPHDAEVKFAIQPLFFAALSRVTTAALEREFLPRFWNGARTILSRVDESHVAECLRSTELELIPVSLDHLQVDAEHYTDLVECYRILLEKSPRSFWDATGAASPQIVIEQICKSPVLDRMLKTTDEKEPLQLEEKLAWADVLIQTINANNIVPPLQTLLGQMFNRFQQEQYSRYAQRVTFSKGLSCLLAAIKAVRRTVAGGPVCAKLIECVSTEHASTLLQELDGIEKKQEMAISNDEQLVLDIIRDIFALETQSLAHDRRAVLNKPDGTVQTELSSLEFWKLTVRHVKPGHPNLVLAMLSGINGLLSLEKLSPAQIKRAPKQSDSWNNALGRLLDEVHALLESLETFEASYLEELFHDRDGAQGITFLLFNNDTRLQRAALDILKNFTGQDSRRDCIMEGIKRRFAPVLSAFAASLDVVARHRTFGPCSALLKLVTDMYGCLCDTQDGVLRSKQLSENSDAQAVRDLWRRTWSVLEMIFETTEAWSSLGYDKTELQNFCRETMDFAESAFDQYSVIANALRSDASKQDARTIRAELLEQPNKAMHSVAKWLRLRDDYLIIKAVSLTTKIMKRLHAADIRISPETAQWLKGIVTAGKARTKTNLSLNQKAELQRALEDHVDEADDDVVEIGALSSKKQGSLQSWVTAGRDTRSSTPGSGNESSGKTTHQRTQLTALRAPKVPRDTISTVTKVAAAKKHEDAQAFLQKRRQHQAEQEKQKAARAKAANLGAGSGVLGLGNLGSEHAVKGQNVMVSSDESDDEDDEDDVDDDIFGTSNKLKKKLERPDVNPHGAVMRIEQKQGPTRIQRAQRSMKDMRARLAPDLTPLHRVILNWDYFHEGDYPPNMDASQFSRVENSFRDPISYQNTFEPLLTLEAWQGMVKSREEINANTSFPYEIKVQNRSTVDAFMEISSLLDSNDNKKIGLQEGDIILLSKAKKPADDAKPPHCLARIYRIKRQKAMLEIVYQVPPSTSLAPHMTMQTVIYGVKIQSITPLEREFGALKALQYYDLCNQIVRAKPSGRIHHGEKQTANFQDIWNLNKAQSEATNAALENDGFTLIQGPPGSGKTKTIVAIVGGLLSKVLDSSSAGATRISMPKANGNTNGVGDAPSKKLLVCAPSNAAVDELVMRLKDGVKTRSGRKHEVNVVRIGRSEAINAQVKDVTMEELVQKKLGNHEGDAKKRQAQADLFSTHKQVSAQLNDSLQQRDKGDLKGNELAQLESAISALRKRKSELGVQIDNVKDQERNAGRQAELDRKRAQQAVLDGAHVICATLSGSGHDMFQGLNIEFETVIIDEAAQCVEMSSLIPLKYGCVKGIMVGDPKQLPPTVFSKEAAKFQYEQSLFVRMQNNNPEEVHLLDTQYRMHPHISAFPSRTFYDGLLKDGQGMAGLRKQPWHRSALLAPYQFYDVQGQQTTAPRGRSFINHAEIEVAMALYHRLVTDFHDYDFSGRVGIITPYKAQLHALKDKFSARYGSNILDDVEFNTTDAFQGRESEVIIFSCVRASDSGGIGFLQDIRRMNVGLTRAKSSLWVLGNSSSLVKGKYWKMLVEDAKARDCYIAGDVMSKLSQSSSKFPATDYNTKAMPDAPASNSLDNIKSENDKAKRPSMVKPEPDEAKVSVKSDPDRMEGVQRQYKDYVSQKRKPSDAHVKVERPSPKHETPPDDVEMADADTDADAGKPVKTEHKSIKNEPATEDTSGRKDPPQRTPATTHGAAGAVPRKRPAPSPFLPRKKPK